MYRDGHPRGGSRRRMLRELPPDYRPVQRARLQGVAQMATPELRAAVLQAPDGLDLAYELLAEFGGLDGLMQASLEELQQVAGMGSARAVALQAALALGLRLVGEERPDRRIRGPEDVAALCRDMALLAQEELRVLLLDTRNRVQRKVTLYRGNVNTTVVRIAEVLREAVRDNAPGIILVHNHPSGDPDPSPEDVRVTAKVVEAGRLLDVEVLDHIIVGRGRFVSLRERGLM